MIVNPNSLDDVDPGIESQRYQNEGEKCHRPHDRDGLDTLTGQHLEPKATDPGSFARE